MSKKGEGKKEQRLVKSLLVILMTSLTIGAPFVGYVLNKMLGMPASQALIASLGILIAGIITLLFAGRKETD